MRITRLGWIILGTSLLAGTMAFLLLRGPDREYVMPDGSVMRVERAIYGKRGDFRPPEDWKERLGLTVGPYLPKRWTASLTKGMRGGTGRWYQNSVIHTNNDALHLWITRRDAVTGGFLNVGIDYGELTDSHGCVFRSTQCGGESYNPAANQTMGFSGPQSSVTWMTFEGFPRHEGRFKLQLYNWSGIHLGELTVANPAPAPKDAAWVTSPLPVVQQQGTMSFNLTRAVLKTNYTVRKTNTSHYGLPIELVPTFEVLENGVRAKDWQPLDLELWDSSGNFASRVFSSPLSTYLCPRERAWKLMVKFYGGEQATGASNVVWKISGVKAPSPGGFTPIDSQSAPSGFPVRVVGLGGIGETIYSNGVPVAASVREKPAGNYNAIDRTGWGNTTVEKVHSLTVHVAVFMKDLKESQRLSVRARDDQGREVFAEKWHYGSTNIRQRPAEVLFLDGSEGREPNYFMLNLWPDAKTVDLTFCVHEPQAEEFVFKPPGAETRK